MFKIPFYTFIFACVLSLAPKGYSQEKQIFSEIKDQIKSVNLREGLTESERNDIYWNIIWNPVASPSNLNLYDPEKKLGFCFGRAMAVHLEALYLGLAPDKIKKLWIFGQLKSKKENWRYHVTTVVRGTDGKDYAIDPILDGPMEKHAWIDLVKKKYDRVSHDADFYETTPYHIYYSEGLGSWFGYNDGTWTAYNTSELFDKSYHYYFTDLLLYFQSVLQPEPMDSEEDRYQVEILQKTLAYLLSLDPKKELWDERLNRLGITNDVAVGF